jgi:hypothetical protein
LRANLQPRLHPNLAEVYRAKVADLRALEAPGERHEAMDLIRSVISKLRLIPEDGGLQFELHGELAGILALCEAKSSKARQGDLAGLAEQIKLVAGAGFEPACASAYASAFGLKTLHWSVFRAPSAFKL